MYFVLFFSMVVTVTIFLLIGKFPVKLVFMFSSCNFFLSFAAIFVINSFLSDVFTGMNIDRSGDVSGRVAQLFCGKYELTGIICVTERQMSGHKINAFLPVSKEALVKELASSVRYVMPVVNSSFVDLEVCLVEDQLFSEAKRMRSDFFERCVEKRAFMLTGD